MTEWSELYHMAIRPHVSRVDWEGVGSRGMCPLLEESAKAMDIVYAKHCLYQAKFSCLCCINWCPAHGGCCRYNGCPDYKR